MPTFEASDRFMKEWHALDPDECRTFAEMRKQFVAALKRGGALPNGLRVKNFQSIDGMFEITWAADGRALFRYGSEKRPGEPHVMCNRLGNHGIYKQR